jgi:hypothetical protein
MFGTVQSWEKAAHIATVAALLIAGAGFWLGSKNNADTVHAQTEALAVNVLQDYMRVAIEHPDLSDRPDSLPVDDHYEWLASHAYFSAETINELTRGEAPWDSTVAAIVRYHHALVRDGRYACHDFHASFDSIVKRELGKEYRCVNQQ